MAAEIQAYPRPIAVYAQFNHLQRRRLLWEELSYIETARGDRTASLGDYLQRSICLDAEAKCVILSGLEPVERGPRLIDPAVRGCLVPPGIRQRR